VREAAVERGGGGGDDLRGSDDETDDHGGGRVVVDEEERERGEYRAEQEEFGEEGGGVEAEGARRGRHARHRGEVARALRDTDLRRQDAPRDAGDGECKQVREEGRVPGDAGEQAPTTG